LAVCLLPGALRLRTQDWAPISNSPGEVLARLAGTCCSVDEAQQDVLVGLYKIFLPVVKSKAAEDRLWLDDFLSDKKEKPNNFRLGDQIWGSSRMQFLSRISVPPRGYKETVEAVLGLSTGAAEYSNPWNLGSLVGKFCFPKCLVCPVASSDFLWRLMRRGCAY